MNPEKIGVHLFKLSLCTFSAVSLTFTLGVAFQNDAHIQYVPIPILWSWCAAVFTPLFYLVCSVVRFHKNEKSWILHLALTTVLVTIFAVTSEVPSYLIPAPSILAIKSSEPDIYSTEKTDFAEFTDEEQTEVSAVPQEYFPDEL